MDVDYRLAFDLAPVGLCVSRNRAIVDCNQQLCEIAHKSRVTVFLQEQNRVKGRHAGDCTQ